MDQLGTYAGLLNKGHLISERYRIEKALGSGGMGSVYLAEDLILEDTEVAIKVLHKHLVNNEQLSKRFLREVKLMHSVNHANVVRTYDFGMDSEHVYFTMEYIRGYSLNALLQAAGTLKVTRAISLAVQICRGLEAIHKEDIVHRDLKPDNILILDNDHVKITDFGVARSKASELTMHDGILGTLSFIAPELLQKKTPTVTADYYSLGIILYQMITGRLPFEAETPAALIMMHINDKPVPPIELAPDIPPWLNRLIMELLAKHPDSRPKDLVGIISLMEAYLRKHEDELSPDNYCVVDFGNNSKATNALSQFSLLAQTVLGTNSNSTMFGWGNDELCDKLFPAWSLSPRTKRAVRTLIATILCVIYLGLHISGRDFYFESHLADYWFNLRGAISSPEEVVIVSMDEQSYRNLEVPLTQAWPRALHTKLLNKLADYGAKQVVFDILFVDQGQDPVVDQELTKAISKIPTVLGAALSTSRRQTVNGSFLLQEYLEPYDPFLEQATAVGLVSLPEDNGVIRRFNTERTPQFEKLLSLAEAAATGHIGKTYKPKALDYINYYGPARSITTYSYDAVIEDKLKLPNQVFKDKTVFVGLMLKSSSGPAQKESFLSPYRSERIYGTEIHATAAANLIQNNWIKRGFSQNIVFLTCILGLIFFFLILSIRPSRSFLFVLLASTVWTAISFYCFCSGVFIPGATLFLIFIPIAFIAHTLYQQFIRDFSLMLYRRSQL